MIPLSWSHGLHTTYTHGCRCDPCRNAHARHMKAYRESRRPTNRGPYDFPQPVVLGDWVDDAACVGSGVAFHPPASERGHMTGTRWAVEALRICAGCPVRADCLAHAIDHEPFGVWGGTLPMERRHMRNNRGAA